MKDSGPTIRDPQGDPTRRLLVSVPAEPRYLPVLTIACRIYSHALPGGRRLYPEVEQAVADTASRICSGTTRRVDVEFRVSGSQLEASVAGELLRWQIGELTR